MSTARTSASGGARSRGQKPPHTLDSKGNWRKDGYEDPDGSGAWISPKWERDADRLPEGTTRLDYLRGAAPKKTADEYVKAVCASNPNLLIAHYLIHSYLYYERDTNIITDLHFADICKEIVRRWETLEHPHKWMVRVDVLRSGAYSGFYLKNYPSIVQSSAVQLAQQFGACLE